MNRRAFLQKMLLFVGALGAGKLLGLDMLINKHALGEQRAAMDKVADYYRIILLGDPHLPVRTREVNDSVKQQRIIEAKSKIIEDINSWEDVTQVHVLGDIVAQFGNETEYAYAKQYFSLINKPVFLVNGNHDYIYTNAFSTEGKFVLADTDSRKEKLNRFKETFGLSKLFYSQRVGRYKLIFLAVDSLVSHHLAEITKEQLDWLQQELQIDSTAPTIIFFHAPLEGTLDSYNRNINTPSFIAMPKVTIGKVIEDNPQIILWVSGHTHTPATNSSFSSAVNTFHGHVTNIHNADMDRETIWTNSLYLYPDRVVIKTFNHREKVWMEKQERTMYIS